MVNSLQLLLSVTTLLAVTASLNTSIHGKILASQTSPGKKMTVSWDSSVPPSERSSTAPCPGFTTSHRASRSAVLTPGNLEHPGVYDRLSLVKILDLLLSDWLNLTIAFGGILCLSVLLWHVKWLLRTERIYYRHTYAIKNQRKRSNIMISDHCRAPLC